MTSVYGVDTVTQKRLNASEEIPSQFNEQFCQQEIPKWLMQARKINQSGAELQPLKAWLNVRYKTCMTRLNVVCIQ